MKEGVAVEKYEDFVKLRNEYSNDLFFVWLGYGGNRWKPEEMIPTVFEKIPFPNWKLVLISEWDPGELHPNCIFVKFNLKDSPKIYKLCDIALAAQREDMQPCKSGIKVLTAWLAGLPVIASPLPEYVSIISHKLNGWIAKTPEEWIEAISYLRASEHRDEMRDRAYQQLAIYNDDYSLALFKSAINSSDKRIFTEEWLKSFYEVESCNTCDGSRLDLCGRDKCKDNGEENG